jgi:16S rRNA (cytosine967-C5)-methyltransferase
MIAPARRAAFDVLRAVNGGRADLPHALARARATLDDERDRALAGEIATGTLRWQAAFDHVVEQFTGRPIAKLDPEVLDVLRLTMFQLLHLDRVPASAAVNDAVDLARKAGKKSAAPLVNAVLRRVSRERNRLPLPSEGLDYLNITLSHPRWLAARWLERHGFEAAEAWMQFDNAPAALTLRVNTVRAPREEVAATLADGGVVTEPTRFAPDGLVVRSGNPLLHRPLSVVEAGLAVVQDEASQLVAVFADPQRGARVLDLCASPGGKTTAMAAAMGDRGAIVACDVRARRVDLLATTVRRSGATSVRLVRADAARALPFGQPFDLVLLDAPCSGLGTLRRDPDIRWRRTETDLPLLADAQLAMLERAAAATEPGGRLVYSTCSSEPEENEEVVRRFLESPAGLEFRPAEPEVLPAGVQPFLTAEGYLRTLPFRDALEAFFAAMLVKTKDLR